MKLKFVDLKISIALAPVNQGHVTVHSYEYRYVPVVKIRNSGTKGSPTNEALLYNHQLHAPYDDECPENEVWRQFRKVENPEFKFPILKPKEIYIMPCRIDFPHTGEPHSASEKAQKWLEDNGYSCGSSSVDGPMGVMFGKGIFISKWRGMTKREQKKLDGTLFTSRGGDAVLSIRGHYELKK